MIDLSEEEVEFNIQTTAKYLKRAAPMKQWLEMVWHCQFFIELNNLTFSFRRSALQVVRRTVLTTKMLTTTPCTPNLKIFSPFTRLCPLFPHTSLLPLVSETSTVSTSPVTSSSTPNFLASTRSTSRMQSEQRRISQFSWFSTADLALLSRSTWMLLDTVLLRSTLIPICSTPISQVSEITFSRRRTISCSKSVTLRERTSPIRNTSTREVSNSPLFSKTDLGLANLMRSLG